ncbi:hypothetical protein [Methylomonas koyamae]|uniref:hypothetical protein n=1 Tax=Methylomonas koyamae TaxID=702114 RepID=UPI0018D29AFA|nr:hypothetical protein [Methylomonas koyamae]
MEKVDPMPWQNRFKTADSRPIGQQFNVKQLALKSDELKQKLANVDLRNISPHDLAMLGGYLNFNGEISDNTVGEFVVLTVNDDQYDLSPNTPIDAIKEYERRYALVNRAIDSGEQGWDDARRFLGNVLHTLYNLDNAITPLRVGSQIDTNA